VRIVLMADQLEGSSGYSQRIFRVRGVDAHDGRADRPADPLLWLGWTVGRWFETARAAVGRRHMGLSFQNLDSG
jgi:hypothetical protein